MVWDYEAIKKRHDELLKGMRRHTSATLKLLPGKIEDNEEFLSIANGVFNGISCTILCLDSRLVLVAKPADSPEITREYKYEKIKEILPKYMNVLFLKMGELSFMYENELIKFESVPEDVLDLMVTNIVENSDAVVVEELDKSGEVVKETYGNIKWDQDKLNSRLKEIGADKLSLVKHEMKELVNILRDGENIIYLTTCKFGDNETWLVVCTDERIILLDKNSKGGMILKELALDKITSVLYGKNRKDSGFFNKMYGYVSIEYGVENITFQGILQRDIEVFSEKIKESIRVSEEKKAKQNTKVTTSKTEETPKEDPIEKLKKLKELVDLGVITQEEFDEKKEDIMKQI